MSRQGRVRMNGIHDYEAVIIGCGIAGAAAAYFLSRRGMKDILILEREAQPGYHATGRSAAVLVEFDLVEPIFRLKVLGGRFLRRPPDGFSENPLLHPCGILMLFQGDLWREVCGMVPGLRRAGVTVEVLGQAETLLRMPVLSSENLDGALFLPEDGHIDVNGLLWGYLRHSRGQGVRLHCGEEVTGIRVAGGRCEGVETTAGYYRTRWVIDAALCTGCGDCVIACRPGGSGTWWGLPLFPSPPAGAPW